MDNKKNIKSNTREKAYQITEKGSLGILALGHIGLREWRKKKQQLKKQ